MKTDLCTSRNEWQVKRNVGKPLEDFDQHQEQANDFQEETDLSRIIRREGGAIEKSKD